MLKKKLNKFIKKVLNFACYYELLQQINVIEI